MNNNESIEDILREMRRLAASSATICWADRIEAAWRRAKAAIESDVMEQCLLGDAARIAIKPEFDKTEFDKAVSGPSAWDAVADPVAEIRKMRGDKEASDAG